MSGDWAGWVYVLVNQGMPGVVKIGHSQVGVDVRSLAISRSVHHAEPFTVAWSGEFERCLRVELGAHRLLDECRLRYDREFFVASVEAARDAILRADADVRCYGSVQAPKLGGAPMPSSRSRRLRIRALYEWLKENHDVLHARICAAGGCDDRGYSVTPIFEELASEWLSSLPSDYRGKRCQPLGVFMEWGRVHREVMFDRQRNRLHLLDGTMMDDEQKKAALAVIQEIVEESPVQRCALVQWMVDNHDELSEMLSNKRPNWSRLAEVFTKLGLSEGGKPLEAETARHYWWRARQIKLGVKRKKSSLRTKKPSSPSSDRPVVRVHAPAPASPRPAPPPTLPAPVAPVPAESSDALSEDAEQKARAEKAQALCLAEMDKRSGR